MQVIAEDGGRKNWPYPSNFTCPAGRSCHSHMLLFAPHTCCVLPFKIWVLHISQKALLAPLYYPPPFPHFQPFQTGSRTCDPWIWNVLWDYAEAEGGFPPFVPSPQHFHSGFKFVWTKTLQKLLTKLFQNLLDYSESQACLTTMVQARGRPCTEHLCLPGLRLTAPSMLLKLFFWALALSWNTIMRKKTI